MDRSEKRAEAERQYASLVIKVGDRDALPVRAIPYVTGWTISPDVVAKNFARDEAAPFEKLEHTDTYHLVGGAPVKLLPKEWDRYVAALQGLEAELREKFANDDRGYAAWVSQSVAKLPAGVFVWLDEFAADFERDYGPERLSIMGEREGDRELNFSPFLEDQTLNMTLEGFERRQPLATHVSDDSHAGLVEFLQNGRPIDWRYWVENMKTLSPAEAGRLMQGLDPDLYEDLSSRPLPKYDATKPCNEAKRMERLAETEGIGRLSPEEWFQWAMERGFTVHRGFFLAGYGRYLKENEEAVLAAMPRAEARRWEEAHPVSGEQRQVSVTFAKHVSTVSQTFPDFCAEVEERLARWRRGRYTLIEAAHVIADRRADLDAKLMSEQMDAAIHAGKLTYRLNNIRVEPRFIPQQHLWHRDLFQEDVNAWLAAEAIGNELRLEYPYPDEPPTLAQAGDSRSPEYEAEYAKGWETWEEIDRVKAELNTWEKAHAGSVMELQAKEERVLTLKARLAELNAAVLGDQTGGRKVYQRTIVMYPRLVPQSTWKAGLLADTDTVTLEEAARFASRQAAQEVTSGDFLRAAARGQIVLRAVVHRTAQTQPCSPEDEPLNGGKPVPKDSIPTLPLDACKALANVGRANWRTFESQTDIGGLPHRYERWELAHGEPDFETTLADCRVTGYDVHALADAVAQVRAASPEAQPASEGAAPAPSVLEHKVKNRADPLAAVIEKAKEFAANSNDYQSVWAALVELAQSSGRPAPLLGYAEEEGVKYRTDTIDGVKFFTKNALRKRMNPDARGR
ncbi:hypothetical protein [Caenimonas soli]|uniref:hypothetical protein n=1 Tax=Caenimonas soli TaxID=2735555 RepID=UPI001557E858|nr:hypothetical protein [Caenimonas soli]NPC57854.1 hypothetical protein [Caenimonas soli]